jgi:sulfite reductase (NADPH) flavoprotein alpha-component
MKFFKRTKAINSHDLIILYGTKSGNSKLVAFQAQKFLMENGLESVCRNMSGFDPQALSDVKQALIIVSTHGEGEPPTSAERFFRKVLAEDMIHLIQLKYSICALGDSSYDEFCEAGKMLDRRLTELGASSIHPRKDCDVAFSDDAINWIKQVTMVVAANGIG